MGYKTQKRNFEAQNYMQQKWSETPFLHLAGNFAILPSLGPSNYYLFSTMFHALSIKNFNYRKDVEKWLHDWDTSKDVQFFWDGIHKL